VAWPLQPPYKRPKGSARADGVGTLALTYAQASGLAKLVSGLLMSPRRSKGDGSL
jgi:hypothetical protein